MIKITKDTTIAEVLEKYPEKANILQKHLHAMCLGCPMSQMETLEDAAAHHEIKIDKLLDELNKK
jgi:hybrid cluster-associated redox disulfide protein